jgi:hypothetical protein
MITPRPGRRLVVAAVIMVVADVLLVFSLAAHVQWGWHLLAAVLVFGGLAGGCAGTSGRCRCRPC